LKGSDASGSFTLIVAAIIPQIGGEIVRAARA
jgi:hypothetical protein